jgi:hypothetical protein
MSEPLPILLAWLPDVPWLIPVIGFVVTCFAFVWGRRLLARQARVPEQSASRQEANAEIDVFLHGSNSDRRTAPRRKGSSVEVLLSRGPDQPLIHGWVVNRSVKGLGLMVEESIPEGTTMDVRPRSAPEMTPWITIEVRRCHPQGSQWQLGCAFVRIPQYNLLLLFG